MTYYCLKHKTVQYRTPPTHLFTLKICRVSCFTLSSISCSLLFAVLLSLNLITFLVLFMSRFVTSRCMLELKFPIYHRAAKGLSSQASTFPCTQTVHNSAILSKDYISLLSASCTCIQVKKMASKMRS